MEGIVIIALLFLLWLLIAPLVALVRSSEARQRANEASQALDEMTGRLARLERELAKHRQPVELPPPVGKPAPHRVAEPGEASKAVVAGQAPVPEPPVLPTPAKPPPLPGSVGGPLPAAGQPELPDSMAAADASAPARKPAEPFSWERFMGVKLFAWLGGVAMFFGVIFFVKYAFENNLIPPAVRIALGFASGTVLWVGGLAIHRLPRYRVLAQAFCGTGVVILYGVSFSAHAIYRFAAFGPVSTFVLMALITLAAFLVAVRLNALVVAVLGMLGGFLTPVLVDSGRDNVFGLFGYIALLVIGLLAVSRHSNWRFLTAAAAAGTAFTLLAWYDSFFIAGRYFEGSRTLVPMVILLGFTLLFLAGGWQARRKREMDGYSAGSVLGMAAIALGFAFAMLRVPAVAERHFLLYGFLLLLNVPVIAMVWRRPQWGLVQVILAALVFFHLAVWTSGRLTSGNLMAALVIYLVFGALHAVLPLVLLARLPGAAAKSPVRAGPWVAPVLLLMMLLALLQLDPVPMVLWGGILLANLLAIGIALAAGAMFPVLLSLVLTMFVAATWLFQGPASPDSLMPFLGVVTGFSMLFAAAGKWLFRGIPAQGEEDFSNKAAAAILPVASAMLPFALLALALVRLPVANPGPVFGVALLMCILLAGLALIARKGPLVLAALAATLAVQAVWHANHFQPQSPSPALQWYLGFYILFLAFPFCFRKTLGAEAAPWIAGALSGVGHFLLVHDLVKRSFPTDMMGLVPAAFAVPSLLALVMVVRTAPGMDQANRSKLAWFGGVSLFFITLIFPIQFDRQWLTVSWAIEGALLIWLFRRVPHPGLLFTGLALLAVCFVRLALNPAVFSAYPRSGSAILNWHLYTFGLVAAATFAAAALFTDPSGRCKGKPVRGILCGMGTVLLFLLLNIEIADYFTDPGERFITFRFGGNFARDMTYSIAWGLFSLALLGVGIRWKSKQARFAAIGLLVLTLLKVFLHDLAAIENVFRIGALVGVAFIAFIASFLYQRFFDRDGEAGQPRKPPADEGGAN